MLWSQSLNYLIALVALAFIGVCCAFSSWRISYALLRNLHFRLQLCGAGVVAAWLFVSVFYALASGTQFRIFPALGTWGAIALLARFCIPGPYEPFSFHKLWDVLKSWRHLPKFMLAPLLIAAAVVGLRIVRSLLAPPMAWDGLTYHLIKAARFIQSGGFQPEGAPNAWSYYEYFAPGGSILYAWSMLPLRGDDLLLLPNLAHYLGLALASYCACRAFTSSRLLAVSGMTVICTVPAVVAHVTASYVDILDGALLLSGITFYAAWQRQGSIAAAGFACVSLAIAASTKQSFVAPFGLMCLVCLPALFKMRAPALKRILHLVIFVIVLGIPLASYWRAMAETCNPMYPAPLQLHGIYEHPGCADFVRVHLGDPPMPASMSEYLKWIYALYFEFFHDGNPQHQNFGPSGIVVLAMAVIAAITAIRRRKGFSIIVPIILTLAATWPLIGPGGQTYRYQWQHVMGRLILPVYYTPVLLCMFAPVRGGIITLSVCASINLLLAVPLGFGVPDLVAFGWVAPPALLTILIWRLHRSNVVRVSRNVRYIAIGLGSLATICMVPQSRSRTRHLYYASLGSVFDPYPLRYYFAAPQIWKYLDNGKPNRVATLYGMVQYGQNQYRYPLLGSRFQNYIGYISPYEDGKIIDQIFQQKSSPLDLVGYSERLQKARVNVVFTGFPVTTEILSLRNRPDLFKLLLKETDGSGALWQVVKSKLPEKDDGPVAERPLHQGTWSDYLPGLN